MLKLITILESLKAHPRLLSDEENLYLDQLGDEVRRAGSDAARWRILEREGLSHLDGFNFSEDVIAKLTEVRRAAMN
ncbi:MAG: hypothetical protein Q8O33_07210 [Pseudomonadota bacterium]|nr:hypothetical protein [Pseudomonadota bacterium]